MTTEIINKIRNRRNNNFTRTGIKLKNQINEIRKEIVKLSFQSKPDLTKHKELMAKLEQVKVRFKQVTSLINNTKIFH